MRPPPSAKLCQCQLVPKISGRLASRDRWEAGEATRLIVTVSHATTVVPGTPPALWRASAIACSALRRITIGNLIPRLRLIQIIIPIERQDLEIEHGAQVHEMHLDKPLKLLKRRVITYFLVSIRIAG
jgi:hypothetical protein